MDDDHMTVDEACEALGVSRWTIYRLRRSGRLASTKEPGGRPGAVRIPVAAVQQLLGVTAEEKR